MKRCLICRSNAAISGSPECFANSAVNCMQPDQNVVIGSTKNAQYAKSRDLTTLRWFESILCNHRTEQIRCERDAYLKELRNVPLTCLRKSICCADTENTGFSKLTLFVITGQCFRVFWNQENAVRFMSRRCDSQSFTMHLLTQNLISITSCIFNSECHSTA